jgi:hypothetical protein
MDFTVQDTYGAVVNPVRCEVDVISGMGRLLKTELYFANGSSEVWVVYPKTRKVLVHRADGDFQSVTAGELCSD